MKKTLLVAVFILLLPAAAFAREKTLYEIAEDMITLAESTISCAIQEGSCTEAAVIALKADAENGLQDIMELMRSGNLSGMKLSLEQILSLSSRLESLNSQLVHIEMFESVCNLGFLLLSVSRRIIFAAPLLIYYAFAMGGLLSAIAAIPIATVFMLFGILLIPIGCLLLLSCLFWWL